MKILAVSDTHGDRDILAAILKQQPNLDGYFLREIRNYLQTIRFLKLIVRSQVIWILIQTFP